MPAGNTGIGVGIGVRIPQVTLIVEGLTVISVAALPESHSTVVVCAKVVAVSNRNSKNSFFIGLQNIGGL